MSDIERELDFADYEDAEDQLKGACLSESAQTPCSVCEDCGEEEAAPGASIRLCLCADGVERALCIDCIGDADPYKSY